MRIIRQVRAQLRRRLLISYRVDPAAAAALLPKGFRPQLVDGSAVAGVCVLGLEDIRPRVVRRRIGLRSENAAHRIAVEWDGPDGVETGVFIFERHSSAWHPVLFGGRLFPGVHRRARFRIAESEDRFAVTMAAGAHSVDADVEVTGEWSSTLFPTIEDASAFYRSGRVGWSLARDGQSVEPVALAADGWKVETARLHRLRSSFFDALPDGAAVFDSVVVMRDLPLLLSDARVDRTEPIAVGVGRGGISPAGA
ncbi:hypothetical protein DXT68_02800 [Microbacterium foliorum]|uniref:DUF2071 domain-containing protein n=1 Tax=Microbacterium foliorum TaxID=104336 RepID=A0A0F0KEF3_9MICO|nr:DUF2071 domain-containing protein [Microbacterium foliorum]AXL11180.1 hypothetical protein DXT68_02800 [Microbacterium foliorum]KJL19282.1 hypothetical protein RN50_02567 [Microbacterium foliorum]